MTFGQANAMNATPISEKLEIVTYPDCGCGTSITEDEVTCTAKLTYSSDGSFTITIECTVTIK